jgi:hypothetical protein
MSAKAYLRTGFLSVRMANKSWFASTGCYLAMTYNVQGSVTDEVVENIKRGAHNFMVETYPRENGNSSLLIPVSECSTNGRDLS